METIGPFDIQTAGIKLANARKKIAQLEADKIDLLIQIDALKLTIEQILLSPNMYDYETGKLHPMNDKE